MLRSKRLFLIALGLHLITYTFWGLENALSHLAPSNTLTHLMRIVGTGLMCFGIAGFLLQPIGLACWKRGWPLSVKFFALTGVNLCFALLLGSLPPDATDLLEGNLSWWEGFLWILHMLLFLQVLIQVAILGVVHTWTKSTPEVQQWPFWLRLVMAIIAWLMWIVFYLWSEYWISCEFCC